MGTMLVGPMSAWRFGCFDILIHQTNSELARGCRERRTGGMRDMHISLVTRWEASHPERRSGCERRVKRTLQPFDPRSRMPATSLNLPNGRMEPIGQTDRLRMATARLWLGYKQKRPLRSGRLLLARTAILLVAREGFEPPTFGL